MCFQIAASIIPNNDFLVQFVHSFGLINWSKSVVAWCYGGYGDDDDNSGDDDDDYGSNSGDGDDDDGNSGDDDGWNYEWGMIISRPRWARIGRRIK